MVHNYTRLILTPTFTVCCILITIILILTSCSSSLEGGVSITNDIVNVKNTLCSFSFTFPKFFQLAETTFEDNASFQYTSLYFALPEKKSSSNKWDYHPADIDIFIYDASDRDATAKSELLGYLPRLKEDKHFTLLDDSVILISGIIAYQLVFMDNGIILSPEISWNRRVYFDYDGLTWRLTVQCDDSIKDTVSSCFEEIINSLKILT
jgi:hypothetical protein